MSQPVRGIVAVDGVAGGPLASAARAVASSFKGVPVDVSLWDGSGIFGEVAVTEEIAGKPSARTLLLLFASDLAFRLRTEVESAREARRPIVVAPYIDTAMAFGRAAGIEQEWMAALFAFAPPPVRREYVSLSATSGSDRRGFVEFACEQIAGSSERSAALVKEADRHLRALRRAHAAQREAAT